MWSDTTYDWLNAVGVARYNKSLSTIGAIIVLLYALKFVYFICDFVRTFLVTRWLRLGVDLKTLGSWAVVTGSTDGAGKEFAKQLAKQGLNIVLISRSTDRLNKVAGEIEATSGVKTKCITVDFANSSMDIYDLIKAELDGLDIAILVNNVGTGGVVDDGPEYLRNIPEKTSLDAVHINCGAMTMMTRIVLPHMLAKNKGAIVSMSSIATRLCVAPRAAVYNASKCYMTSFSRSVQLECKSTGLIIQTLEPAFMTTKFTRGLTIPLLVLNAETFVRSALRTIGVKTVTTGHLSFEIQALLMCHWPTFMTERLVWPLFGLVRVPLLTRSTTDTCSTKD